MHQHVTVHGPLEIELHQNATTAAGLEPVLWAKSTATIESLVHFSCTKEGGKMLKYAGVLR